MTRNMRATSDVQINKLYQDTSELSELSIFQKLDIMVSNMFESVIVAFLIYYAVSNFDLSFAIFVLISLCLIKKPS